MVQNYNKPLWWCSFVPIVRFSWPFSTFPSFVLKSSTRARCKQPSDYLLLRVLSLEMLLEHHGQEEEADTQKEEKQAF